LADAVRNNFFAATRVRVAFIGNTARFRSLAFNRLDDTTNFWVTVGVGTFVSRSTSDRSFKNSFSRVASFSDTVVWRSCRNESSRDINVGTLTSLRVTRVFGTNVVVVARFRSVDTFSGILVARVFGTCVVVITRFRGIDTFSGDGVARIDSTCVVIVTNSLNEVAISGERIAGSTRASIFRVTITLFVDTTFDWVARIIGTCVKVVTDTWGFDKFTRSWITSIRVTEVIFLLLFNVEFRFVLASELFIADINSTCIVIFTFNWGKDTFCSFFVTRIGGTCITIVTLETFMFAETTLWIARVDGARVVVVTVNRNTVDSVFRVTFVQEAKVITERNNDRGEGTNSSLARIGGTSIVVVTNHRSIFTSGESVTRINSTWVLVITRFWSKDTSKSCIARVDGTNVVIITNHRSIFTSGESVTRINSTWVLVITVQRFLGKTFS